ncbi:MAG: ATP-binding protein [Pirellulales bacterium]
MLVGLGLAALVVFNYHRQSEFVVAQAREHNRVKMHGTRGNIEDYVQQLRMSLRFITADTDVRQFNAQAYRDARNYFQAGYDRSHLWEACILRRDFERTGRSFLRFKPGEMANAQSLPAPLRDSEEYRTDVEFLRRFMKQPAPAFLLQAGDRLCDGRPGLLLAAPIHNGNTFMGMITGTVPMENVAEVLERGNYANMVVLVDDRGALFGCKDLPAETAAWFRNEFRRSGPAGFFAGAEEAFRVGRYVSLWTPVELATGQKKWYLAFMYEDSVYSANNRVLALASWGTAGLLLVLAGAVVVLSRMVGALSLARQQADSDCRSKGEFLANMSHEIRTPMTAILGFTEVLRREEHAAGASPECIEAIDTITRNGEHLLRLINDILDLSRIEAGRFEAEAVPCSPSQVMAEVQSLMQVPAGAKGLRLETECASPIPETIHSDPLRLRQILLNLVGNAIKFTEQGSIRLRVQLVHDGHAKPALRFDVVDTGIGMTSDQMVRLFRPFSQADQSTTRRFGGSGLGLAISQRLAQMLGGQITVQSKSGQGSVFSLAIPTGPLAGVKMIQSLPVVTVTRAPDAVEPALDCRILLAEDGPDNQRLISFLLKKAGARVTVVENGQRAVEEAMSELDRGDPFDVILMDMQMPVLDGYEASTRLRRSGYTGTIVALTAHAMADDRAKCLEAGCDDYVTKPIDRAGLIKAIRRHLTRRATEVAR